MNGKIAKLTKMTLLVSVALTVMSAPAFAYLDPGTGSMILQGIVGAIAGGLYVFRNFWARFVTFLPFGKKTTDNASGADAERAGESRD